MNILSESIDRTGEFSRSKAFADYESLVSETSKLEFGTDEFFRNVETYIKYGNFSRLGKGSSRTAYAFDADPRYVLKFAHNDNGLKQNQTELKNAKLGTGDYSCVVRILAYDDDCVFIVEDRCGQSSYEDWLRIVGMTPNMLSKIVRTVMDRRRKSPGYSVSDLLSEMKSPSAAAGILRKTSAMDDEFLASDFKPVTDALRRMIDAANGRPAAVKWTALYDLFRFYFDNGMAAMIPEELLYTDQWGVKRGRTPDEDSLVIIDPGVDEDFMPFVGRNGRVGGAR